MVRQFLSWARCVSLISSGAIALLVFFLPSYVLAALPTTTNLTAYFPFDENTASTTADSSGNGHTGSLSTGVVWQTGQIGSSVLFNKVAGSINTGADYIGSGAVTVTGWIRPYSTGQSAVGKVLDNGQTIVRVTGTTVGGRLSFSSNNSVTIVNSANNAVSTSTNTWTHFAITRDANGLVNMYVNNALSGSPNQNAGATSSGSTVYIGNRAAGGNTFDGNIDDIRIYSRVLSAGELTDIYTATASYPDTMVPSRSAGSPSSILSAGTTQTTLSLTTDEASTCKYGTVANTAYASIANIFSTTGGTSHSSTITGLVDGTSYTYYVRCQDGSGNANTNDYTISFSVADIVVPVISNVTVASVFQTRAIITWTTNENSTSTVNYGATASYGSASTSASYVTSHSITLTGLTPNTTYHYQVSSADLSNNVSTSTDATLTTTSRDTWYVDSSATGLNDGTSLANAWTSFANINQSLLNANDVILIYSGTYDERFTISKSGTSANARIIYKGVDDGGGKPILRGINGGTYDYVALIGLEISHYSTVYSYPAIYLAGSDGWLIEDNYIHDTEDIGIDLHYNTVNNSNIIRHNTLSRIGMVPWGMFGASAVSVFGDSNLIEYNIVGLVGDYFLAFGSGNIIRNNYSSYTSELEFMDGINGQPRSLATTTGGDWNSSTGVWTKVGTNVLGIALNDLVRIYPDGGDSYSFSSVVTATSTNSITVRLTDYVGTVPTDGTGNRSAIVVKPGHIDCFQSYNSTAVLNKILIEKNWCENNNSRNSHGLIIQDDAGTNGLGWLVQRGNVYYNLGSATHIFTGFTRAWIYNNTFYNPQMALTSIFNSLVSYSASDSVNHSWINNTWDDSGQSSSQNTFATTFHTNLYADYNHIYGGSTLNYGSSNLTANPLFTNTSSGDFTLQSASPLRAAGRYATLANGSGASSVTLIVDDAYPFSDGWSITPGDFIKIGSGEYVQISSINYGTNTITLASARTWSDNDTVIVRGMEDIGALPYDYAGSFTISLNNTYLPAGSVNLTATVSDTDAVRMVEYLVDGIPVGISYVSPYTVAYTADGNSHSVTARAYNAWASQTLIQSDTETLSSLAPSIPDSAPQRNNTIYSVTTIMDQNKTPISSPTPTPIISSTSSSTPSTKIDISKLPLDIQQFVSSLLYAGVISQDKLGQALSNITAPLQTLSTFKRDLQLHDRGSDVKSLQSILISKGYLPKDSNTGYFGTLTIKALKKYQSSIGLPATGYFGPLTKTRVSR